MRGLVTAGVASGLGLPAGVTTAGGGPEPRADGEAAGLPPHAARPVSRTAAGRTRRFMAGMVTPELELDDGRMAQLIVIITLRTVLLTLHVAGGLAGLAVGLFVFHPPETVDFRAWLRRAYAAAIGVLAVFLVATVAVDWSSLGSTQRIIFSALIGLAAAIVVRVAMALRLAHIRRGQWQLPYVNHIYFSYISLWEGFFIVGLIDLRAPGWIVAVVAVGVLVLGGFLVNRYKRRLSAR